MFKHLIEDADDGDWVEVVSILFLVNVFAKEVDLRLILVLGGSSLVEALVVEVK